MMEARNETSCGKAAEDQGKNRLLDTAKNGLCTANRQHTWDTFDVERKISQRIES